MSRTVSHIRIRYSKSRLISGLVREAPAVRRMIPIPSGTSRSDTTSFSRERSCAALLLDHLNQHHLATLDDFLNLVLAAGTEGALRHLFQNVIATDGFDDFLFGVVAILFIVLMLIAVGCSSLLALGRGGVFLTVIFGVRGILGMSGVFFRIRIIR